MVIYFADKITDWKHKATIGHIFVVNGQPKELFDGSEREFHKLYQKYCLTWKDDVRNVQIVEKNSRKYP